MKNSEIVFANRVFLMEQGVIKGIPGTSLLWKDDQGEREIMMPEEIKTFDAWRKEGFIVQKGQHAVAKFQIWMPKSKKAKQEVADDKEMQSNGFYMKVAYFFTLSQVKKIDKEN